MAIRKVYISKERDSEKDVDGYYFRLSEGDDKRIDPAFYLCGDREHTCRIEPSAEFENLPGAQEIEDGSHRSIQHVVRNPNRPIRQYALRQQVHCEKQKISEW